MRLSVVFLTAMLCASAPALAQVASNSAAPAKDKLVCKRSGDFETGSRLRRESKVCRKESEWKELDQLTERALRDASDTARPTEPTSANGPSPNPQQ